MAADGLMLWFAFDDLAYDLPFCTERFREILTKEPTVLWTKDGRPAPEGFALEAKADGRLGENEMFLE